MTCAVRARGLTFAHAAGAEVLAWLDLTVAHGERVAVLGPKGAGKTTLMLHLNGLLRGSGELEVAGLPVRGDTLGALRARVGLVFQDPDDQLFMTTVAEDVAMEPELLVLDEPSANLDPRARRELLDVLAALDRTLLVVTHDLPFAAELCERAVILSHGRVAADGPCAALLSDPALLAGHDLELPAGFDPARVTRRPRPAGVS